MGLGAAKFKNQVFPFALSSVVVTSALLNILPDGGDGSSWVHVTRIATGISIWVKLSQSAAPKRKIRKAEQQS